ncbi:hypothetical protein RFI_21667 [Reticulomyxa filosa]|uniref:Uncharacterized protein n=1 Tax=Reticulomyxa filosa TaxID=46433 RepID=X6MNX1_RETFI|nr:hypothetical protein RFI_21667 [Reticulomyxa filosa]|eukprot:ETO15698.1 hypothetical protein RFI_21667 [Reticulomyxa filosa]
MYGEYWIMGLIMIVFVPLVTILVIGIAYEISHVEDIIYVREEAVLYVLCLIGAFATYGLTWVGTTDITNKDFQRNVNNHRQLRDTLLATVPCIPYYGIFFIGTSWVMYYNKHNLQSKSFLCKSSRNSATDTDPKKVQIVDNRTRVYEDTSKQTTMTTASGITTMDQSTTSMVHLLSEVRVSHVVVQTTLAPLSLYPANPVTNGIDTTPNSNPLLSPPPIQKTDPWTETPEVSGVSQNLTHNYNNPSTLSVPQVTSSEYPRDTLVVVDTAKHSIAGNAMQLHTSINHGSDDVKISRSSQIVMSRQSNVGANEQYQLLRVIKDQTGFKIFMNHLVQFFFFFLIVLPKGQNNATK